MQLHRCEPQQTYNEMSMLLRPNNVLFLKLYFGDTHRLMYKKPNLVAFKFTANC